MGNDCNNNAMMLGIALDGADGHRRVTKGDNFQLVGGSEETHEAMTETALKINETLARKGRRLDEISGEEFRDIFHEVTQK